MKKYRRKPLEALTFDEFEALVREKGIEPYCSFEWNGAAFTKETAQFWIMAHHNGLFEFRQGNLLVLDGAAVWIDTDPGPFHALHEPIPDPIETRAIPDPTPREPVLRSARDILMGMNGVETLELLHHMKSIGLYLLKHE